MPSKLLMRKLPSESAPNVADVAGLMGPLGVPGAVGTLAQKASTLTADDLSELNKLLGRTMQLGKRLVRLSSAEPAANKAIVHTNEGERLSVPLTDFLHQVEEVVSPADPFPEGAVISARGVPAPQASFGPKGGLLPPKRRLR